MMLQNGTIDWLEVIATIDWLKVIALILSGIAILWHIIRYGKERQRFSVEVTESKHKERNLWIKIKIINRGRQNTTVEAPTLKVFDNDTEIEGRYEEFNWEGAREEIFPLRMEMDDIKDNVALRFEFDVDLSNDNLEGCLLNTKYAQNIEKGVTTDFTSTYTEDIHIDPESVRIFG